MVDVKMVMFFLAPSSPIESFVRCGARFVRDLLVNVIMLMYLWNATTCHFLVHKNILFIHLTLLTVNTPLKGASLLRKKSRHYCKACA